MENEEIRLQQPIVLVHGLGARGTYGPVDYFYGLPARLRQAGNTVMVADLTAWHSIEHRAKQLRKQIEEAFPEGKVNLVGHSMGGLDARYLASKLDFSDRIASVTTIGTPNRGSILGDLAQGIFPDATFAALDTVLGKLESSVGGFKQVSQKYCTETFCVEVTDAPNVAYFSATSAIKSPLMKNSLPIFWLTHQVVKKYEGDNDGFVSVESAKWGEHICTYNGDHYAQIGQFLGRSRGMDYLAFYDEIFGRLSDEGF